MEHALDISAQIESLLFFKGEPVKLGFLASTLKVSEDEVQQGIATLETTSTRRGVVLVRNGDEIMLCTAPAMGATIETLLKEEISKDLGKAGLETLAIVLYQGPVPRSEINYIRGVNSNYILRSLLVRGLIEKVEGTTRSTTYRPSFELLSYMGVSKVDDLPEYASVQRAIEEFKIEQKNNNDNQERESLSEEI